MQAKIVYRSKIVQCSIIRLTREQRKLKRERNEMKRKAIGIKNGRGGKIVIICMAHTTLAFFFFPHFIYISTVRMFRECIPVPDAVFSDLNANRFHLSFWRFLKDFFRPELCWCLLFRSFFFFFIFFILNWFNLFFMIFITLTICNTCSFNYCLLCLLATKLFLFIQQQA